jgi:hypothetical protein
LSRTNSYARSLDGTEEGEEFLARRADATFVPGLRTLATWVGVSRNPKLLYLGAYIDENLGVVHDFEAGRRSFLYVAGTGGNIQKGLDILLEAFSRNPHLHLYIFCRIEDEILDAYEDILALPNIHYIFHLRFGMMRERLAKLLRGVNFTITAPIDTGSGTAFVGSLGAGFIPVGYVDIDAGALDGCLSTSWQIEAIEDVIRQASEMSLDWYKTASARAVERYWRDHDPTQFGMKFGVFHDDVAPKE